MSHEPSHLHSHAQTVELMPAGASDSHGAGHHGHTIVPMRLLVMVLATLMFFTVLTVLAANGEELFARMFHVHIPGWVNVFVALSIGAIKSIIVALYFMQLRYDTPVNALVAVFTIMVLTFFLGFTMIDLGNRGVIYDFKGKQVIYGGFGDVSRPTGEWTKDPTTGESKPVMETIPSGTPIAVFAREKADRIIEQKLRDGEPITSHAYQTRLYIHYQELAALPAVPADKQGVFQRMHEYIEAHEHEFEHIAHELSAHARGHSNDGPAYNAPSSGSLSRPRTGLTPHLFDGEPGAPAPEKHDGPAHGAPAAPAHSAPAPAH